MAQGAGGRSAAAGGGGAEAGGRMLRRRPGRGSPCCYLAGGWAAAALCIVGAAGSGRRDASHRQADGRTDRPTGARGERRSAGAPAWGPQALPAPLAALLNPRGSQTGFYRRRSTEKQGSGQGCPPPASSPGSGRSVQEPALPSSSRACFEPSPRLNNLLISSSGTLMIFVGPLTPAEAAWTWPGAGERTLPATGNFNANRSQQPHLAEPTPGLQPTAAPLHLAAAHRLSS